jgi:hypothetical protein
MIITLVPGQLSSPLNWKTIFRSARAAPAFDLHDRPAGRSTHEREWRIIGSLATKREQRAQLRYHRVQPMMTLREEQKCPPTRFFWSMMTRLYA